MTLFRPANIEFLLWCHTRCKPYPDVDLPMYQSLIVQLLNGGAIEKDGDRYITTEKGAAWVQALCDVEEPREAFIDAAGNVIKVRP